MGRSKKNKHKSGSRNHTTKTTKEREIYDQKVRYADSEGGTKEQIPSKTSTLSTRSVYAGSESTGIPDRDPIKPPLPSDGLSKWVGIISGILAILCVLAAAFWWIANLKNQVSYNEKQIRQLDTNLKEVDSKRESLNTRIAKLEQWKDFINDDLRQIKADVENGVSIEQIDIKLIELEQRVFKEYANRKTKGK